MSATSSLEYLPFPKDYTIKNVVIWAEKTLQECGIDSTRLEAELLLMHILNCERTDLYLEPGRSLNETMAIRYKKAIQRRSHRVPLQYITNHAEFMSLGFYVDERVLIPRPETEVLVEAVVERIRYVSEGPGALIVDIGVGSGNIAIALSKILGNVKIFAIDSSTDALAVAKINTKKHQVMDKITLLHGDIFQPLNGLDVQSKVDCIVSNPPYIAEGEFSTLQEEVRDFEPYNALISGKDGTEMFERIIKNASTWLKPEGMLFFEVGEKQAFQVMQLIDNAGSFKNIECMKDYRNIDRIVIAQMEVVGG